MHVVHVETGRHVYGGAMQVLNLITGLAERGVRGTLVCPDEGLVAVAALARGIEVVTIPCGGDLDIKFMWRLRRVIRELRPTLVHVHSRRGADRFGGIAALLAGVPAVLSRRVDSRESFWARPKYWFYRYVIAISGCIRDQLRNAGVPDRKIRQVASGASPEAGEPSWTRDKFLSEFDLPGDAFVVGVIAQLIPRKGHRYLIEALPRIRAGRINTYILLFGAGSQEQRLQKAVEQIHLDDAVRFAGFRTDLAEFIGHLDLLVHPATREGLGLSLLEAQAAGVPVVGFRAGGVVEAVNDGVTGRLVSPGNVGELERAVLHLAWRPRERAAMGAAARDWIAERFSIERMVSGNLDVYREVIGD